MDENYEGYVGLDLSKLHKAVRRHLAWFKGEQIIEYAGSAYGIVACWVTQESEDYNSPVYVRPLVNEALVGVELVNEHGVVVARHYQKKL